MNLNTIEITAPELPDQLPSDHQELMNIFYEHFSKLSHQVRENNAALQEGCNEIFVNPNIEGMLRAPYQREIAEVMPPKVNAAVILGNFNYQVCNGGFLQYDDNGYSESVDALHALLKGAAALGIEDAREVLELVEEFQSRKADDETMTILGYDEDDEDDSYPNYNDLDTRYYAKDREPMLQAVLDRFEEIAMTSLMAGAYRKAA